jgi:hypothetical protein
MMQSWGSQNWCENGVLFLLSSFIAPKNADDLPRQARDKQQKGQSLKTGRPFFVVARQDGFDPCP